MSSVVPDVEYASFSVAVDFCRSFLTGPCQDLATRLASIAVVGVLWHPDDASVKYHPTSEFLYELGFSAGEWVDAGHRADLEKTHGPAVAGAMAAMAELAHDLSMLVWKESENSMDDDSGGDDEIVSVDIQVALDYLRVGPAPTREAIEMFYSQVWDNIGVNPDLVVGCGVLVPGAIQDAFAEVWSSRTTGAASG